MQSHVETKYMHMYTLLSIYLRTRPVHFYQIEHAEARSESRAVVSGPPLRPSSWLHLIKRSSCGSRIRISPYHHETSSTLLIQSPCVSVITRRRARSPFPSHVTREQLLCRPGRATGGLGLTRHRVKLPWTHMLRQRRPWKKQERDCGSTGLIRCVSARVLGTRHAL